MSPRRRLLVAGLALSVWQPPVALAGWGNPVEAGVPSDAKSSGPTLVGVSCAAAGTCAAIGNYQPGHVTDTPGLLLDETAGSWATGVTPSLPPDAQQPGNRNVPLNSVSCAAPGECAAVGSYLASAGRGLLLTEASGRWGRGVAPDLPAGGTDSSVSAVSCPAAGSCVAVGAYTDSDGHQQGMIVQQASGRWGAATQPVLPADARVPSKVELDAVSCSSPGNCAVVGSYVDSAGHGQGLLLTESGGTWGAGTRAQPPADARAAPGAGLAAVSCPSDGGCTAVGGYHDSAGHGQGLLLTESSGIWEAGTRAKLPADAGRQPSVTLKSVSCGSAGNCSAVGTYQVRRGGQGGLLLTETAGAWAQGIKPAAPADLLSHNFGLELTSVSCASAGNCAAVGSYGGRPGQEGLVIAQTSGVWGRSGRAPLPANAATPGNGVNANASLSAVSCAPTGGCSAVGYFNDSSGQQGLLVSTTPGLAKPSLALSAPARARAGRPSAAAGVTATLNGAKYPAVLIRFAVFGPRKSPPSRCTSGGTNAGSAVATANGGFHPSRRFKPQRTGTYWWFARFAGDASNAPAATPCGAAMAKTVVAR